MTDDLAAFITARLDEDEAAARASTPGPWGVDWANGLGLSGPDGHEVVLMSLCAEHPGRDQFDAIHIARHDPARALREVEAKRRILHDHTPQMKGSRAVCSRCHYGNPLGANWPCLTIESLAAVWSDHPGYRAEWKP